MNEQWEKVLSELITKVTQGTDAAIEFSKQQIPDILQQLLMWRFIENLLSFLIPLVLLIIFATITHRFWKIVPKQQSRDNDGYHPWIPDEYRARDATLHFKWWFQGYISPCFTAIMLIIFTFNTNLVWLKIWIAPKLYLLEYAASLIKS